MMEKFEVGKTYSMRSACDHNCVWSYKVIARTAQTVTLADEKGREISRKIIRRISEWNKAESVYPLGQYSMAPVLVADRAC